MRTLGIDIGTTHIKVGLFEYEGDLVTLSIQANNSHTDNDGHSYYDPAEMWDTVQKAIKEVMQNQHEQVGAVGITSMAETGVLVDTKTNEYLSHLIPWFDRRTESIADFLEKEIDLVEHFKKTGLHLSYKYGLAKILWLKQQGLSIPSHAVWLSSADFIAYKLTGKIGTDYSLAARTYAFRIDQNEWDVPLIHHFNLNEDMFPEANQSGTKIGEVQSDFKAIGLGAGIPVAVCGHDHVCAALAVGAVQPGIISNSVGTAETLVGSFDRRALGKKEYEAGFNFGCHAVPSQYFWMGAIQSSGGSVEWFRKQFASELLSYADINNMLEETVNKPTGILYYPYLAGSGAPIRDPQAKGAFIGIKQTHSKGELLRAVLEGTAYELEHMKRAMEDLLEIDISTLITGGGGTKNKHWMQIRSDVTNCHLSIPSVSEATLLGAALIAGVGCGVYQSLDEVLQLVAEKKEGDVYPNETNHLAYRTVFEEGYLPLQAPLRAYYAKNL